MSPGLRGWAWVALVVALPEVLGWRQWDYLSNTTEAWSRMWGSDQGPRGRKGHSMVLDGTRVILFGGRDDETVREHTPRTFDIQEIAGVRSFNSYERLPVYTCELNSTNAKAANSTGPYYGGCMNNVTVGLYYNDVWVYELNCTR
jgi:hypothetical protein